jgi:polyphosphate kinase 2 (PPK2 family)
MLWDDDQKAYAAALENCSSQIAPWYIVPAEKRWFRNLLITKVLVETLESMDLQYPEAKFDPKNIVIP